MTTSLLRALLNIKKYGNNDLRKITVTSRANQPYVNIAGDALDSFVRDAFCNSFTIADPKKKAEIYRAEFSYLGSQNHPPDLVIKGSDAIEVKKVGSIDAQGIQLNSSYPKTKLKSNSPLLTRECIECDKDWKEKDIIYAVGHVINDKLRVLTFVYGDCYAADGELYEKIRDSLVEGIEALSFPFSETMELARLNNVDPLKITSLRLRGMWIIRTPLRLYSDIMQPDLSKDLSIFALMRKEKFDSFSNEERDIIKKEMKIADVKVKDPNRPQALLSCKLISLSF